MPPSDQDAKSSPKPTPEQSGKPTPEPSPEKQRQEIEDVERGAKKQKTEVKEGTVKEGSELKIDVLEQTELFKKSSMPKH